MVGHTKEALTLKTADRLNTLKTGSSS